MRGHSKSAKKQVCHWAVHFVTCRPMMLCAVLYVLLAKKQVCMLGGYFSSMCRAGVGIGNSFIITYVVLCSLQFCRKYFFVFDLVLLYFHRNLVQPIHLECHTLQTHTKKLEGQCTSNSVAATTCIAARVQAKLSPWLRAGFEHSVSCIA